MDAAIFGVVVADVIAEPMDLRHPPEPGGLHLARSVSLSTGGNACNVAIDMRKLGMNVASAGLVGRDVLGAAVLQRLREAGVETSAIFSSEAAQTCATVVAVEPGGERCFFHAPGVSAILDAADFRRCFDLFKRCRWVQIGYFGLVPKLTPELPGLLAELRQAAPKTLIALDTANPPADWELLKPILPHVDLFCPSRPEAMILTGESEPEGMAGAFRKFMRAEAVAGIKLDAEGCYIEAENQGARVSAYGIELVDTTGAGDAWFAGLLTGRLRGMNWAQAARLANRVAADCCTALGASAGVKSYEETVRRT